MNPAFIKRLKIQEGEFNLQLHIGEWKNYIPQRQVKLIIAEALTHCVKFEPLMIKGYLITNRKVCLMLICEEEDVPAILFTLYKQIRNAIRQEWHRLKKKKNSLLLNTEETKLEELLQTLFHEHPFKNEWIIKLITGQKVELPYYNPDLERLKKYLAHYNFCSAIDYLGGVGPVKMTKRKNKIDN